MAAHAGITHAAAESALAAALQAIAGALEAGNRVRLPGFGAFEPALRAARTARHPRTGEVISVPRQTGVKFTASAELRARLNHSCGGSSSALS